MAWFPFTDRKAGRREDGATVRDGILAREREFLLREIAAEARMAAIFTGRPELDPRVLDAVAAVPRERFVRPNDTDCAYLNQPLPIGHGQTISQPFVVALMTDLLQPMAQHVVLDVSHHCVLVPLAVSVIVIRMTRVDGDVVLILDAERNTGSVIDDRPNLAVR